MKVLNLLIICAVCVLSGCATPTPTRVAWEYKTIRWRTNFEAAEVQLNELAKQGWIVVDHSVISGAEGYTFVLKRPLK
jgi:hypothetical protein